MRLLAALVVVALAALAGWYRPIPAASGQAIRHEAAWKLPGPASLERSSAAQFAALQGVAWIGGDAADGGNGGWTLVGVSERANEPAALVRNGSGPLIKRYQTGDTLPDGSRLVSIGRNGIVTERGGCRVERLLYAPSATAAPEGAAECAAPERTEGN
jgi:hypothetical protein